MDRWRILGFVLVVWLTAALGIYELTAKSPRLLGAALPGWWAAERAEHHTRWRPPTGVLPVDKLLHEGQEAARFYAMLAGIRTPRHGQSR